MFLIYLAAGLAITGALFFWAVMRGQFKDQNRARYLALDGIEPVPRDTKAAPWPREIVLTVAVAFSGMAVLVALVLLLALK